MTRKKTTPPQFRVLSPHDYRPMKWKNGLGETQEIAIDTQSPFRWRLSSASVVSSSAFSVYTGYDRHFVVVEGGPLSLSVKGGDARVLPQREVYCFSGDIEHQAILKQPCRDLNLFCDRKTTTGSLHIARYRGKEEVQLPYQGDEHFVFCIDGEVEYLDPNSDQTGQFSAGQTLWITRPAEVNLLNLRTCGITPSAHVAWAVVSFKSPLI